VAASRFVSDRLGKDDRLSIVAYESKTHEVYSPDGAPDAEAAGRALGKLRPLGGTNMEAGLRLGLERLKGLGLPKSGKRLLLLSDGQANEGIATKEGLAKIASGVRELGGSISTFGVGADYNEDLMAAIAEAASGNYHVIDRGEELAAIFAKEFEELGAIVGSQARLALQLPAGLELVEAFGYPMEDKGGAKRLVLRDLYHGMKTKVVMKLAVAEGAPTKGEARVETRLGFVEARDAGERTALASAGFTWVADPKGEEGSRNDRIAAIAEELEGARELDQASRAYAEGDAEKAKKLLQGRLLRNQEVQSTMGASAENLAAQNMLLEKAMDRFEAPAESRDGKAAVKWLKQGARMSAY
jgi:Ca-activated chloride channel family protein